MAYDCTAGVAKTITSDCSTQHIGGVEDTAWIFSRKTYRNSFTFDSTSPNKVTAIAPVATKQGYLVKGVKQLLDGGHNLASAVDRADRYTHYVAFQQFEVASADILNVDALEDVFIVFERKHKTSDGDGVFVGYGLGCGLNKSNSNKRENAVDGARIIELTTPEGAAEKYSEFTIHATTYQGTLDMLNGLMTPPA
jgi:hypothetical protein